MYVCVFLMITAVIPYMVLVMFTMHVYSCPGHVQNDKNVSSVPKLINGKWSVSLGQKEGQLKSGR